MSFDAMPDVFLTWGAPTWPPIPPNARARPGTAGAPLDHA